MENLWTLGGLTWRELISRTARESWDDEVFGQSARLAFYHFLAIFPALVLAARLMEHLSGAGSGLYQTLEMSLTTILPPRASETLTGVVREIGGGSKLTIWYALLGAVWAALNGTWAVMSGLNVAYEVREGRPWWKTSSVTAGLTLALAVLASASLIVLFYGRQLGEMFVGHIGHPIASYLVWQVLHWAVIAGLLLVAFALFYRFGPNLPDRQMRWSTPGAVIAMLLWLTASGLFRSYVAFQGHRYDEMYGSAGALAILLLWFYFTGAAILIGGEANSEIENAAAQRGHPDQSRPGDHRAEGTRSPRA